MGFLTRLMSRPPKEPRATEEAGVPGFAASGGYLITGERHPKLQGANKFKTYLEQIKNLDIIGLSIFYYLQLVMSADWSWDPPEEYAEDEEAKEYAEKVKRLFGKMRTAWLTVVARLALFEIFGFAIMEWTLRKDEEEGCLGFLDIGSRPAWTIEKWNLDPSGHVLGVWQTDPNTGEEHYIPIDKCLYLAENTIDDIPEGLGLMRLAMRAATRLERYEQLEGYGFEADLRGTPVGYGPFDELLAAQRGGKLTEAQRLEIEKPLKTFVEDHFVRPDRGLILDSSVYRSKDTDATPSAVRKWSLELVKGGNTTQEAANVAIERLNRQIARIFGTEHVALGGDKGAYNLSEDKTNMLMVRIDSVLGRVAECADRQGVEVLFEFNGWDKKKKPRPRPEAIKFRDASQIAEALSKLAAAGATILPGDPIVNAFRDLVHMPRVPEEMIEQQEMDAAMRSGAEIAALEAGTEATRAKAKATLEPPPRPAAPPTRSAKPKGSRPSKEK